MPNTIVDTGGHTWDLDCPNDRVLAAIFGLERAKPKPPAKRATLFVHPQGQPNVTVYYVPVNGRVEVVRKVSAP